MKLTNPGLFFSSIKTNLFNPSLSQSEVDGINEILTATIEWPKAWTAYALATAYHETAHTMQPIKEFGGPNYFFRMYDINGNRPEVAKQLGNIHPGDGAKYFGRGFVELTGLKNYTLADNQLELNGALVANPDLALDPTTAAEIMEHGMRLGWFSGHKLEDMLPQIMDGYEDQFVVARSIINGSDKANLIAGYAMNFQTALTVAM